MKAARKAVTAAALLLSLIVMTGCVGEVSPSDPAPVQKADAPATSKNLTERHKTLQDGRVVVCVSYDQQTFGGGLSCDWAGAK